MIRIVFAVLAVLPALSTVAAVEPPAELASAMAARDDLARALSERLRADDARIQAWAAYEVGAHRVAGAREALLALLAQMPPKEDDAGTCRYRSALDALIRLDGAAPPAVVAAAAADPRFRVPAIILAARAPAANLDALLGLLDAELGDATWLAVCELLEEPRPPKLAEHLLGGLTLRLELTVRDDRGGGGSSRFGSRFATSHVSVPDGFPPYPYHYLTTKPEPGAVVLTGRYCTVYRVRAEVERSSGYCVGEDGIDRDAARIDLLGRLTRPWSFPQLEPLRRETIVWSDAETCRTEATADYEKIRAERQRLVDQLIEERLLAPDVAGRLQKPIAVTVRDARHGSTQPLPELPFAATIEKPAPAAPAQR